ncbi:hypothetical protein EG334_19175 [Pectobacterium versatile]|nr:hypothetical protein EG334_19175 [Pectobacterium versatile]
MRAFDKALNRFTINHLKPIFSPSICNDENTVYRTHIRFFDRKHNFIGSFDNKVILPLMCISRKFRINRLASFNCPRTEFIDHLFKKLKICPVVE